MLLVPAFLHLFYIIFVKMDVPLSSLAQPHYATQVKEKKKASKVTARPRKKYLDVLLPKKYLEAYFKKKK